MPRKKESKQSRRVGKRSRAKTRSATLASITKPRRITGRPSGIISSQVSTVGSVSPIRPVRPPVPPLASLLEKGSLAGKLQPITLSQIAAASGISEAQLLKIKVRDDPREIMDEILSNKRTTVEALGPNVESKVGKSPRVKALRAASLQGRGGPLALRQPGEIEKFTAAAGGVPKKYWGGSLKNELAIKGSITLGVFLGIELILSMRRENQQERAMLDLESERLAGVRSFARSGGTRETAKNKILLQALIPSLQDEAHIAQQAASSALSPGFNPTNLAPSEILIGSPGGTTPEVTTQGAGQDQLALIRALQALGQ